LEVDYEGKVSSMKTMLDASELSRQISSLHGLNSHTASIFLRYTSVSFISFGSH
jgi:hypothetical protein